MNGAVPTAKEPASPEGSAEPTAETRPSMAELERELAELLDEAPLLPEDDDEGSGVDFVPPPNLGPRRESEAPANVAAPPAEPVAAVEAAPLSGPARAPEPVAAPEPIAAPTPRREAALRGGRGRPNGEVPATGKGKLALVTTLVVAVLLVGGTILTWPTPVREARVPKTQASSVGPKTDAREPATNDPRAKEPSQSDTPVPPTPSAAPPPAMSAAGTELAPKFSVVDMLTALAPAGIEAGRCRHTGEKSGRLHVRVTIAEGGAIESVFAGHAYKDSETAACIERKIRSAKLPPFSGKGGSVVLAVDLR